jgi:hypothetical protein
LSNDNKFYNVIAKALQNTQAESFNFKVNINGMFEINKATEKLKFMPFEHSLHNKFLLWTGIK